MSQASDVHIVRGDFDEVRRDARLACVCVGLCNTAWRPLHGLSAAQAPYDEDKVVTIGQFRIGLCHGHQVRQPCTPGSSLPRRKLCSGAERPLLYFVWLTLGSRQVIPWGDKEALKVKQRQVPLHCRHEKTGAWLPHGA